MLTFADMGGRGGMDKSDRLTWVWGKEVALLSMVCRQSKV